jgi:hypothetical protein
MTTTRLRNQERESIVKRREVITPSRSGRGMGVRVFNKMRIIAEQNFFYGASTVACRGKALLRRSTLPTTSQQ